MGTAAAVVALSTVLAGSSFAALEEIVIEAQRRSQGIQEVPLSVTAFSGDQVEDLGMERSVDIAGLVPNVEYVNTGPTTLFSIRGISLFDFGDANEPTTAFYQDDTYLGTIAGQQGQLFDLERVEILRGPQGTLYGRNATGGLIHFYSAQPTDEFEGRLSFQYGSYNQIVAEAMASGPLSDRVRARAAVKYNEDDGWQENQVDGADWAKTDTLDGRLIVDADLSDQLSATFTVQAGRQDNISQGYGFEGALDPVTFLPCSAGRVRNHECVNFGAFMDPKFDPTEIYSEMSPPRFEIDHFAATLRFEYDFENFSVVSISSYRTVEKFYSEDADADATPLFQVDYNIEAEQFTQELRASGSRGELDWTVGAFYYEDEKSDGLITIPTLTGFLGTLGLQNEYTQDTTSWALYAQGEFGLSENVSAIGGLRYTNEEKDLFITDSLAAPGFSGTQSLSTDNITWRIGLNYEPNDDLLLFGSVSTGFKSGAFNTSLITSVAEAAPVGEEDVTNYELGVKSTLFGGLANLNVTAFFSDYRDIQLVALPSTTGGLPISTLINGGDATIYGAEIEFLAKPTDELTLMLSAGHTTSELDAPGVLIGGVPIDGNELPFAPELQISGLAQYERELPNDAGSIGFGVDFNWRDDFFNGADNLQVEKIDGYTVVGARLFYTSQSGRYTAELFADNVFDEERPVYRFNLGDFVSTYWGEPLRVGAKFTLNY